MNRRTLLQTGLAAALGTPLLAALREDRLEEAAEILKKAVGSGQVAAATICVRQKAQGRSGGMTARFGRAADTDAMFLLGSITKPICMTALMTLFDKGEFTLDDPVKKFLPEFTGDRREQVTVRHLLTHTCGLPDQLPENNALRKGHASLADFVAGAIRTPLEFVPGSKYQYSSMGILLAAEIGRRISGVDGRQFVEQTVFKPLGLKHAVLGTGRFKPDELIPCQTEHAAPESGAGDPTTRNWDWNSSYWRQLGAPWGGAHLSAPDVATWLAEFLEQRGQVVKPATARLMTSNQNGPGLTPRGLGFNVGKASGSPGCSDKTFGHTGSTGTIAWADPATGTICVILTSLPGRAVTPHPRSEAAAKVAEAMN